MNLSIRYHDGELDGIYVDSAYSLQNIKDAVEEEIKLAFNKIDCTFLDNIGNDTE